jgi:hypothetical protein
MDQIWRWTHIKTHQWSIYQQNYQHVAPKKSQTWLSSYPPYLVRFSQLEASISFGDLPRSFWGAAVGLQGLQGQGEVVWTSSGLDILDTFKPIQWTNPIQLRGYTIVSNRVYNMVFVHCIRWCFFFWGNILCYTSCWRSLWPMIS